MNVERMTGGGLRGDVVRADPKGKRRKKSKRQSAEAYCDAWFSLFIRTRDVRCVTCGSTDRIQCSHMFPGRHHSTKWRPDCAFAQCAACHTYFHHQSQLPLIRHAQALHGIEWVDHLREVNHREAKFTTDEIMALGDGFREKVRSMTNA